jgi:putative MFS transporter
MRTRTIHTWMIWVLPLMASWGMNFWIPQLFVKLYGLPLQSAVKNMFYISFFSMAGRFLVYFLSEKVGRKFFIALGFSMAGILLFPMIGVHTAVAFFWFAAWYQFFMEMGLCGSTIYVPEVYPVHIRVLGASTAMGLGRIGGAIGSAVIGYCVGAGMMTTCWVILGGGSLIAGLATIWMGIEPKGQNLEQLNKDGTIGAAKLHQKEVEAPTLAAK